MTGLEVLLMAKLIRVCTIFSRRGHRAVAWVLGAQSAEHLHQEVDTVALGIDAFEYRKHAGGQTSRGDRKAWIELHGVQGAFRLMPKFPMWRALVPCGTAHTPTLFAATLAHKLCRHCCVNGDDALATASSSDIA